MAIVSISQVYNDSWRFGAVVTTGDDSTETIADIIELITNADGVPKLGNRIENGIVTSVIVHKEIGTPVTIGPSMMYYFLVSVETKPIYRRPAIVKYQTGSK